jgi:hypothetical protein
VIAMFESLPTGRLIGAAYFVIDELLSPGTYHNGANTAHQQNWPTSFTEVQRLAREDLISNADRNRPDQAGRGATTVDDRPSLRDVDGRRRTM